MVYFTEPGSVFFRKGGGCVDARVHIGSTVSYKYLAILVHPTIRIYLDYSNLAPRPDSSSEYATLTIALFLVPTTAEVRYVSAYRGKMVYFTEPGNLQPPTPVGNAGGQHQQQQQQNLTMVWYCEELSPIEVPCFAHIQKSSSDTKTQRQGAMNTSDSINRRMRKMISLITTLLISTSVTPANSISFPAAVSFKSRVLFRGTASTATAAGPGHR
ncbi:uncharacterized protein LOC129779292 [Toxorhynchites rutilus septentrionalis]|uniref:uncharacterized protein LOC129779292 n=1 Tax=Toxorhynchites rutilus septentrionalis TaxID=329112 RepID=UPI00247A65D7|nr:uncharacterized protein LOC129779292 [Toxorhynchites rutilus septentrionalis]